MRKRIAQPKTPRTLVGAKRVLCLVVAPFLRVWVCVHVWGGGRVRVRVRVCVCVYVCVHVA